MMSVACSMLQVPVQLTLVKHTRVLTNYYF